MVITPSGPAPPHAGEVVQVEDVGEYVVGDQVRLAAFGNEAGRELPAEELDDGLDPRSQAASATLAAGSTPSAGMPRSTTCWSR